MSLSLNASTDLLALVDFRSPVLWAVIIGWILSVTLHEFAHGLVGYLGGDYTVRERGLLTLNPLNFVDPLLSIGIPLLFLLIGRVPLMGGVTYIRNDLLRSKPWQTAVSLAGPATNFCLFLLLAVPFHPQLGWIHFTLFTDVSHLTSVELFLCTLIVLQFLATMINVLPIPGIDGFGAILPYFDEKTQALLSSREARLAGLMLLYFALPNSFVQGIYNLEDKTLYQLGFDEETVRLVGQAFNKVLYNH